MLLDQLEDNLDNSFIYKGVVAIIRPAEGSHAGRARPPEHRRDKPNIPMLGDAEFVAVLDTTNAGMVVTSHGSIDDVSIRTHVRQVLEGGEEAFMRRFQNMVECDPNCRHHDEPNCIGEALT